jgi:hypothetical protein
MQPPSSARPAHRRSRHRKTKNGATSYRTWTSEEPTWAEKWQPLATCTPSQAGYDNGTNGIVTATPGSRLSNTSRTRLLTCSQKNRRSQHRRRGQHVGIAQGPRPGPGSGTATQLREHGLPHGPRRRGQRTPGSRQGARHARRRRGRVAQGACRQAEAQALRVFWWEEVGTACLDLRCVAWGTV